MSFREDAVCPYCREKDRYRMTAGEMTLEATPEPDGHVRLTFRRRPWELAMMEHLRTKHRPRWRAVLADMQSEMTRRMDPGHLDAGI